MANLNDHSARSHALLSASSAYRWLVCPPSAVAAAAYPSTGSEYADEGTLAHEVAEAVVQGRTLPENDQRDGYKEGITEEMIECAQSYKNYISEHVKAETDVIIIEAQVDFSLWVPDGFGTADCIIISGDKMTVIDYKYGKGVAVDAKDNPQLRLYALGALNDYGFAYDIKDIEMHIYQPRINNISVDSITAEKLLKWAEKTVKPTATKAYLGKGKYKAGEHCRFCPHAGRCRQLTNVCVEHINLHGIDCKVPQLTPFEIAEVLNMQPMIELWLKRVKEQALTGMLNRFEIPGYKVVEGRASRAWSDDIVVLTTLKVEGYKDEEVTKTELLSPAAMEKALGKKKVAEIVGQFITIRSGAPTIAPESDKRPAYDRLAEAQKDFE